MIEIDNEEQYRRDGYTIAHAVCYRPKPQPHGQLFIMMVKTVEGKIEYPSVIEGDPVIKFYVGIVEDDGIESQHWVVQHGIEIQHDSLKTFFNKVDY
jgi:hypothetical protein